MHSNRITAGFNPLGLRLHSIGYDFDSQTGTATVEGSPDGSGTIQFFQTIDPEVRIIHISEPGRSSTYLLKDGKWSCRDIFADPCTAKDLEAWMESCRRDDVEALPEPPTRKGPIVWAPATTVPKF